MGFFFILVFIDSVAVTVDSWSCFYTSINLLLKFQVPMLDFLHFGSGFDFLFRIVDDFVGMIEFLKWMCWRFCWKVVFFNVVYHGFTFVLDLGVLFDWLIAYWLTWLYKTRWCWYESVVNGVRKLLVVNHKAFC